MTLKKFEYFETIIGEEGMYLTHQDNFGKTIKCCKCGGNARIGFVTQERFDKSKEPHEQDFVYNLHKNKEDDKYWLHDLCSVAIYFCEDCLEPTAEYNQG